MPVQLCLPANCWTDPNCELLVAIFMAIVAEVRKGSNSLFLTRLELGVPWAFWL